VSEGPEVDDLEHAHASDPDVLTPRGGFLLFIFAALAALALLSLVELGTAAVATEVPGGASFSQRGPGRPALPWGNAELNCRTALPLLLGRTEVNRGLFTTDEQVSAIMGECHRNAVPVYLWAAGFVVVGALAARGTARGRIDPSGAGTLAVIAALGVMYGIGRTVGTEARAYDPARAVALSSYVGPHYKEVPVLMTAGLQRRQFGTSYMSFADFARLRYMRLHADECEGTPLSDLAIAGGEVNNHLRWGDYDVYVTGCNGPAYVVKVATWSYSTGAADAPICGSMPGERFVPRYCDGEGSTWLADFFDGDAP
jgi:hypothetical protein